MNNITVCMHFLIQVYICNTFFSFQWQAFCCIATGALYYPNEMAADIALEVVREWLKINSEKVRSHSAVECYPVFFLSSGGKNNILCVFGERPECIQQKDAPILPGRRQ